MILSTSLSVISHVSGQFFKPRGTTLFPEWPLASMIAVLIDECLPASCFVSIIIIVLPTLTLQHKPSLGLMINNVAALFTAAIYLASASFSIAEEPKPIIDFYEFYY